MKNLLLCLALSAISFGGGACGGDDSNPPPQDAAGSGDMDGPPPPVCTAATAELLTTCTSNDMCAGCECKVFGHERYCSRACTGADDCPSTAVCYMGYCTKP